MAKDILDPNLLSLEDIMKNNIFNVPIYQRPYSWGKEEVDTLLSDIDIEYKKGNYSEYYVGNIIIYDMNEKVGGKVLKYHIIDGQQRTITFSLVLLAIYSISRKLDIPDTDNTLSKIKECLWKYIDHKYKRELHAVEITGIEKECYNNLYDQCLDNPTKVMEYCEKYENPDDEKITRSIFEIRIIENFKNIYNTILEKYGNTRNELLDYADYLLNYMKLIQIEANCDEKDVFSMFESINSKGKMLEPIDLIKSYIFSILDTSSYDECSKKWGRMTVETNDALYDYLYVYIRAYINYYRQKFSADNFKKLCETKLKEFFHVSSESEAVKAMIDDMDAKLNKYKMLSSTNMAYKFIKKSKFRFFYEIFVRNGYEHPKSLFFRAFNDYAEDKISEDEVINIVIETTLFMLKFNSILGKDSKDAITSFANILNYSHTNGSIDEQFVINELEYLLQVQNINKENLADQLSKMDSYNSKKISVPILSLLESAEKNEQTNSVHISYDQAFEIYSSFSNIFSLDHLMVQTPDKNDNKFKYYKEKDEYDNEFLKLKEGNDFPEELVYDGMNYDDFTKTILNRLGNLRIWYKDKNSSRQNTAINLNDDEPIFNYTSMMTRSEKMLNMLFDECLPKYTINSAAAITYNKKKTKSNKYDDIRMKELLSYGEVYINDKLILKSNPDNSEAVLIDDKHVLYNGKVLTLMEWGLKVTGWKSINIYRNAMIKGEEETLQEKRDRYLSKSK